MPAGYHARVDSAPTFVQPAQAVADRDAHERRKTPSKAQRAIESAIEYGSKPPLRAVTESDGAPPHVDRERSTPVALDGPGIGPTLARIEERQRDALDRDLAIAKGIGDIRIAQTETNTLVGELVKLAAKADTREDKREDRQAEERKSARSGRKEIILAVIGLLGLIAGAYGLGTRATAPASQIQMTTPAPAVQR